jgi:hypothetical protein
MPEPPCTNVLIKTPCFIDVGVCAGIASSTYEGARDTFLDLMRLYHKAIVEAKFGERIIPEGSSFAISDLGTETALDGTKRRLHLGISEIDAYGKSASQRTYNIEFKRDVTPRWTIKADLTANNFLAAQGMAEYMLESADKLFIRSWRQLRLDQKWSCGARFSGFANDQSK